MLLYYFFRLMCIFVTSTYFVKRGARILVDEIPRYRNYHYYYCYDDDDDDDDNDDDDDDNVLLKRLSVSSLSD